MKKKAKQERLNDSPVNITKRTIATLKRPAKGYELVWDTKQPRFGVRVMASGMVTFIVQGRIGTVERRITLGRFPTISPDTARTNATIELGKMADGTDPIVADRRNTLAEKTLATAFAEYADLRRRKGGLKLKESTKKDMAHSLEWAFGSWKSRKLTSITRDHVEKKYQQLTASSVAQANLAMRYLRAVFNFEADRMVDEHGKSLLPDNPTKILKRQWNDVPRRTTTIKPDQLPAWVAAVEAQTNPVARDLLLFLALTGSRRSEAMTLKKGDVDLAGSTLTFRNTKNRRDHELPLTKRLGDLLARRIKGSPSEWVFADGHGPIRNLRYAQARVQAASGVSFSPHDLRRTAATEMERAAVPQYTIKGVLNHLAKDVTGEYVQIDPAMKLAALAKLEKAVMAKEPRGTVVPMVRRGAR